MRFTKRQRSAGLLILVILMMLLIRGKGLLITKAHPVALQMERRRISRELSDYRTLHRDNFIIHYQEEDNSAARLVQAMAGHLGSEILRYFDYQPADSIRIVLYSHEKELKGILRIPDNQSAMGAYAGGLINLLTPKSLGVLDQDPDSLANVFVHELAHLALDGKAKGNYPLWFTEGSALYLEYVYLEYEWGKSLGYDPSYSLEDLTYRFHSLDEQAAYRQSFLMVKKLIETGGRKSYLEFLRTLGKGANFQEALTEKYGKDIFS